MVLYIHNGRHATNFAILAGCALADLGVVDTIPDERCVGLQNSAQFTGAWCCVLQWCHTWVPCCLCLQLHSSFGGYQFERMSE